MVAQEVEIYQKRAEEKDKIAEHLFRQNMEVQQKLSDTQDALESASRLTEQLDRKEETISRLRDESKPTLTIHITLPMLQYCK